jgi:FkbM family methyltransferase
MPVTAHDVETAYRVLLGREPENQDVVRIHASNHDSVVSLCRTLICSPEYRANNPPHNEIVVYSGVKAGDHELLEQYSHRTDSEAGFRKDFVGSRTRLHYIKNGEHLSGLVEEVPYLSSVYAEAIEWIGTIRAVDTAGEEFVTMELGAGWGPWIVASSVAARNRGIKNIRMIACEGDKGHVRYLQQHLQDNGFTEADCKIHYGVAAAQDGQAFFPMEGENNWGAEAVFVNDASELSEEKMLPGLVAGHYIQTPAHSFKTIIGDEPRIDLLHVDIQGAEYDVLVTARKILQERVRWMMIGTHSRMIEAQLMQFLHEDGWILENEKPCKFNQMHGRLITHLDGAQVWRNPNIAVTKSVKLAA